jgi:heme oxygenase (biliverdin-producing, ferredoxin)
MAIAESIDLSQDIATLLRIGTAAAHDKAEHSEGAGWLVRGELDEEEYVRFLMMLYHVYECVLSVFRIFEGSLVTNNFTGP